MKTSLQVICTAAFLAPVLAIASTTSTPTSDSWTVHVSNQSSNPVYLYTENDIGANANKDAKPMTPSGLQNNQTATLTIGPGTFNNSNDGARILVISTNGSWKPGNAVDGCAGAIYPKGHNNATITVTKNTGNNASSNPLTCTINKPSN